VLADKVPSLDLDLTIESGQVFLWSGMNGFWYGIERDNVVKMTNRNGLEFFSYPEVLDYAKIFRFDDDLDLISRTISKDLVIKNAIMAMRGLRLMRQDPYQCLISFICATNTSIFMIKRMLTKICTRFGKKIMYDNLKFHLFPEPSKLANASIAELRGCSVGYRAPFIRRAARAVRDGEIDFDYLRGTGYENAKENLMDILGVGNKVADCILLFSLEKLDSFPIDVWIARAVLKHYSYMFESSPKDEKITPKSYRMISSKMRNYFGRYAGYAQQYLYCYSRTRFAGS
jgi:N-glycosylase/DNA lyase